MKRVSTVSWVFNEETGNVDPVFNADADTPVLKVFVNLHQVRRCVLHKNDWKLERSFHWRKVTTSEVLEERTPHIDFTCMPFSALNLFGDVDAHPLEQAVRVWLEESVCHKREPIFDGCAIVTKHDVENNTLILHVLACTDDTPQFRTGSTYFPSRQGAVYAYEGHSVGEEDLSQEDITRAMSEIDYL